MCGMLWTQQGSSQRGFVCLFVCLSSYLNFPTVHQISRSQEVGASPAAANFLTPSGGTDNIPALRTQVLVQFMHPPQRFSYRSSLTTWPCISWVPLSVVDKKRKFTKGSREGSTYQVYVSCVVQEAGIQNCNSQETPVDFLRSSLLTSWSHSHFSTPVDPFLSTPVAPYISYPNRRLLLGCLCESQFRMGLLILAQAHYLLWCPLDL